jgi:hypothetical protein
MSKVLSKTLSRFHRGEEPFSGLVPLLGRADLLTVHSRPLGSPDLIPVVASSAAAPVDAGVKPIMPETATADECAEIAAACFAALGDPEASPEMIAVTRAIVSRLNENPIIQSILK